MYFQLEGLRHKEKTQVREMWMHSGEMGSSPKSKEDLDGKFGKCGKHSVGLKGKLFSGGQMSKLMIWNFSFFHNS